LTAAELIASYRSGDRSPVEVVQQHLDRLELVEPRLNAFITVTAELALSAAAEAEQAYADGTAGPLAGVPVSIKDLVELEGVRCTRGSLVHADHVSTYDDPLAARIRASGAAILGKTATPEYGWKGETSSRVHGSTHNPWRHGLTAGGSSGGAAAAAAAGVGVAHSGGDGAGSIRMPCGFSGVFGIKPTPGVVRHTVGSGLSSQGSIAFTVADAALLLTVMSGEPYADGLGEGIDGARVAWSGDLGYASIDPAVREVSERAARRFSDLGCRIEDADPGLPDPWPIVDRLWAWQQSRDEDDQTLDLIDQGRRRVVERGRSMTEAEYEQAQADRGTYADGMARFFERFDLLLTPTLPCPPFAVGLDQPGSVAGRPTEYLSWTQFTYPFNASGQPAASVPCGMLDGLPVGLQIVGRPGDDRLVLRGAAAFEAAWPWPGPPDHLLGLG
jgi:aspartyl-tRNA(Asn)/glutamyl-tRNA(Gln) amidotransferase subunit A